MSRKAIFTIFVVAGAAVIAALLVSGSAFAQGAAPLRRAVKVNPVLGSISAIGSHQFTLTKRDGAQLIFQVGQNTQYRGPGNANLAFADLHVGDWVTVAPSRKAGEASMAHLVLVLPAGFTPAQTRAGRGQITQIDTAANTFTLQTPRGERQVIVDSQTTYLGQVSSFADLQIGMQAGVVARLGSGNELAAEVVRAGFAQHTYSGEIQEVNAAVGTFELKTARLSQVLIFSVDQNTRFRSRDGSVAGLQDLETGMTAVVTSQELAEQAGSAPIPASVVTIANRRAALHNNGGLTNRRLSNSRFSGQVTALGKQFFTIQDRLGERVTFQFASDTVFLNGLKSRAAFSDLQVGTRLTLTAQDLGNGNYQAQIVVIALR